MFITELELQLLLTNVFLGFFKMLCHDYSTSMGK